MLAVDVGFRGYLDQWRTVYHLPLLIRDSKIGDRGRESVAG